MISESTIYKSMQDLIARLDKDKCLATLDCIDDGYSISVTTFFDYFCPFTIKATSSVFDILVLDRFALGDVSHNDFIFSDVAMAIALGRVLLEQRRILLFSREYLIVNISSSDSFCITGSISLNSKNISPVFSSYVL